MVAGPIPRVRLNDQSDLNTQRPEDDWYTDRLLRPQRALIALLEFISVQNQLLFLIGPPRSGSTLLNRMLGAHPAIHAPVEPHLLTPLAHLGYYDRVTSADYDPIISQLGIRELVEHLPEGETDYLEALRAYTDGIYSRLLDGTGSSFLLDKTPAYALVLDFVTRLYPDARYIVLTRHPLSVWSSIVDSFFDGDHETAHRHNPVIERYVPAMARFLKDPPAHVARVSYENLVTDPEGEMKRLCDFIGIPFDADMVDYGKSSQDGPARGLGDPMTVASQSRPTTDSLGKWAQKMTGSPEKVDQCRLILAALDDRDLEVWGYDRKAMLKELDAIDVEGKRAKGPKLTRHVVERRLLVFGRRRVRGRRLGHVVRGIRNLCDLLLR